MPSPAESGEVSLDPEPDPTVASVSEKRVESAIPDGVENAAPRAEQPTLQARFRYGGLTRPAVVFGKSDAPRASRVSLKAHR